MSNATRNRLCGWPDLANVVLAFWLFLSPFILGHYEEMTSSMNAYVTASVIGVFAASVRRDYLPAGEAIIAAVAVWLMISPWALGFNALTDAGTLNAVITGLVALGLAAWSVMSDHTPAAPEAV